MYRSFSSLRSLPLRSPMSSSCFPIIKHSTIASSPAIMTTIGAATPVKLHSISLPKFSTLSNSPAIMTTIGAATPVKLHSISLPKFSTLSNSPAIMTTIGAATPVKLHSISLPKFSTLSNSPAIVSSLFSPTIVKLSIISLNSISCSTFTARSHSPEILSSLSSPSIVKPSILKPSTRSYGRFPPMIGSIPAKPKDAMNTRTLNANFASAKEFPDSFVTPESAVAEIKLAVCKNPDSTSNRPAFKVHNLRSSYEDHKGNIVNLIREIPRKDRDFYDFLMETATEVIKRDMNVHNITNDELKQLWWPESGDEEDFWATALLKHSRFSLYEAITDYASKTFELANPMINGTENQPGLGEFLEMRGFTTGKYHDVADLLPALKDFFTVDAYPTFVGHGGYHPALFEVGVLANKDCRSTINHPMSTTVPQGKFLMRRL